MSMPARKKESRKIAIILCTIAVFTLAVLASTRVYAQVSGATMSGTVTDASGSVVPNAQVTIRNVGTGQDRVVTTDTSGFYSAPNLLPGQYQVTTTAPGFNTEIRSGITLTVGAQQLLNISMQVGQVSQTVEVTTEAPNVQLTSSAISGVVSQTAVVELPLNGRDWTQLATLQPGVNSLGSIQANTGSKDRARRGYGVEMTISGTRPTQTSYRIDGVNVNDYTNGGPGSVEGSTLGVDAVQEFSVVTSNYSAEYGRTSGGVVNALLRSGTNQIHGDVYEFLRNNRLDARNPFDPEGPTPAFQRNQFGGSLGGPIWKDRTFFFADYEGLRQNQTISTPINVPSLAARSGVICSVPSGDMSCTTHQVSGSPNPDPTTGIDTAVLPYLGLWGPPDPNSPLSANGDVAVYTFAASHITTENFGTARLDHKFSDKDSVFASYQIDSANATQPDQANDVLVGNTTGRAFVAIEETHVFSGQLVNSARIGFNRSVHTGSGINAINPLAAKTALGESAGADNMQIDVPSNIVSIQPGLNQVEQINFFQNSFQGYDDLFLTKGIHSLKFGFAVERIQTNVNNPAPVGEINFNSLENFLNNHPDGQLIAPLPGFPFVGFGFRTSIFGFYAQDDVRLRHNLTLNLGLRYEMSTVPYEVNGRLSALRNPTDSAPFIGHTLWANPTYKNFEPRLGFAWDPSGSGKTSVRGGFGMFDVLPLAYEVGQFATNAAPFTVNGSLNTFNPGDFPLIAFQNLVTNGLSGMGLRYPYVDPNPKRNYVMQWNVAVQRELLPNLTAMVAYVGSRGVHMEFRADNINTPRPILTPAGYLFPLGGAAISPTVGQMDALTWNNDSFYNGLELQVTKRMSRGFEVQGSYTRSRAVDGGDGAIASDSFVNSLPGLFAFLPKVRRSVADFNVTQNLTINYLWQVPSPKSISGPAGLAVRGWQLGGILELRSGLPFTPLIGGDPLALGTGGSAFDFPNRVTGSGCDSAIDPSSRTNYLKQQCFALPQATPAIAGQCQTFGFRAPGTNGSSDPGSTGIAGTCANLLGNAGRNSVNGPGIVDFDFSVFKDNKIKENLNLQFRAEIFNLFNRSNFNSPLANLQVFDSSGNASNSSPFDSTSTSSREIQFALKLIF